MPNCDRSSPMRADEEGRRRRLKVVESSSPRDERAGEAALPVEISEQRWRKEEGRNGGG